MRIIEKRRIMEMDIGCVLGMVILGLGLTAMFLGYKAKFDRKQISLEKNDQLHELKHKHNEERIKELEKKDGKESTEIDKLNKKIETLEEIIAKLIKS